MVVLQLLISIYLIVKFTFVINKPLSDWDYAIVCTSGWLILMVTMTTGVIGKDVQNLVNETSPYKFNISYLNP